MNGITSVSLIGGEISNSGHVTPGGACLFRVGQEGAGGHICIHLTPAEAAQWASVLTKYAEATK